MPRSATCDSRRGRSRLEDGSTKLLPVLVITAAHSRFVTGRMIQQLRWVPRRLIWDNEPDIGRGPRRAEGVASFMGTLATRLVLPAPNDPLLAGQSEVPTGADIAETDALSV